LALAFHVRSLLGQARPVCKIGLNISHHRASPTRCASNPVRRTLFPKSVRAFPAAKASRRRHGSSCTAIGVWRKPNQGANVEKPPNLIDRRRNAFKLLEGLHFFRPDFRSHSSLSGRAFLSRPFP